MKVKISVNGKSTITKKKKSKEISDIKEKQGKEVVKPIKNGNVSKKKQNAILKKGNKVKIEAAVKLDGSNTTKVITKTKFNLISPVFSKNDRTDLPLGKSPSGTFPLVEKQKKKKIKEAAVKLEGTTKEVAKDESNPFHPVFLRNYRRDTIKLPGVIEQSAKVPFAGQQNDKKNKKPVLSETVQFPKQNVTKKGNKTQKPVLLTMNAKLSPENVVVNGQGKKKNRKRKRVLSETLQSPKENVTKKENKAQIPVLLTRNTKHSPGKVGINGQEKKRNRKRKPRGTKQQNNIDDKTTTETSTIKLPETQSRSDDEITTTESPNSANNTPASKKRQRNRNKKIKLEENQPEEPNTLESSNDDNTIFVGNLPNMVKMAEIENLFKKYGKIQGIRLRSAAPPDQRIPKKVAVITRDFHKDSDSINAFVRFNEKFEARNALIANGSVFKGHHLRVDYAKPEKQKNNRASIFVGNLPFTVRDDELWESFKSCGEIESVRIIRDKETRVGKGFGYVNFKSPDGVELALQLEDVTIQKRKLRITRQAEPKVGLKDNKNKNESKKRKRSLSQNENINVEVKNFKLENDGSQELKKKFQGEKSAARKLRNQTFKKKIKKMRNEKHKKSIASLLTSKPGKKTSVKQ